MPDESATYFGQGMTASKLKPAIARRIEELGVMNDIYNKCLANGDKLGLLELAGKYEERGMDITARRIRLQAAEMKG